MLKTKTVSAEATPAGIRVSFEGESAPAEPLTYEMVLVAVGRTPNGKGIDAERAGVAVSDRGFIAVDNQMRTNMPHIFAIGDIIGQPMLAHKAVHEAHVAAETAAGKNSILNARQIPSVAYTDPEIAWAGLTEDQCRVQGLKYGKAVFPWAASGRAIANGRDEGFTKLLFDEIEPPGARRRHCRHPCGRSDRRNLPCRRNGLRSGRHRQDDPSASDIVRIDRHGGGSIRRSLHRPAAHQKKIARGRHERAGQREDMMEEQLRRDALEYHRVPTFGKISVTPTKSLMNQRDLALAYSPGVAYACLAIRDDPNEAATLTSRANLVAVITNGTAVLGLGNIGALAGKPVMEGKACLFKKFAGIDVFDIEINESNPDKFVEIVASLEPTFGGINLEDIKAPECFYIERALRKRMKIPVFHDDQHGTAIIAAAAVLNGLELVGKDIRDVKLACSGAGAAAIACLDQLVSLGLRMENILVADAKGVVYEGRAEGMDPIKARYARPTSARTLGDIVDEADIFLGLSAGGVLKPDMVKRMAKDPLILALANPTPEISPEDAKAVRPDAIIATGRSDYPNQVNNVLCFPFLFRGALDVGATTINEDMKSAAVRAIAELAHAEMSDVVATAYGDQRLQFGPNYLIPTPFDPRLIERIAPAVAKAAMDSGVATRPLADLEAYRQRMARFMYQSGSSMEPVFAAAKITKSRCSSRKARTIGSCARRKSSLTRASLDRFWWGARR